MNIRYLSNVELRTVIFATSTLLLASCGGGGSSEPAIDTTPASFSFTEQSEIALESDSVSSVITVSGINSEANISIEGGEYSVNGSDYTSAAAVISNGQQVQVRHTSSDDYSTATTTTLTIGGVSSSFSSTTQDIDTIPASFVFTEQYDVEFESESLSNVITVSGINAEVDISINGGEYSVNGGAYTSTATVITNGQQIRVKHTSSADYNTATTTTLTIGGVSGSYSSTTWAIDTTPVSFVFTEQSDVELNSDNLSNVITVSGINAYANISIDSGEYSIDGGVYTSTAAVISNGQQVQVRHTSSADYSTTTTATLTIGGVPSSFTTLTITKLSFVTGCTELYGVDCTNVDDWTATLWQDDLSEVLEEKSFSDDDILRLTKADDKEIVNYSVSGTISATDNSRTIGVYTFLGVNANQTYTFSTTELGFPVPKIAPLSSDCETFTLTVNGIPAGNEQLLAVKMYNPNNPHLPVFFEQTNLLDTDDSQDYTVSSCDNSVLVILSRNEVAYAEFDTKNVVEGENSSVTLLTPSTSSPYNVRTHLGRVEKKGVSILSLATSQYIFSPEAAGLATYDYRTRESCPLISEVMDYCLNDARSLNDKAAASTVNLTFADFSITQFDLNMDERQLDVNWSGAETPTSFILGRKYSGDMNGESITLRHIITFSATILSTAIPPLPDIYQSWLDNGDITLSEHYLILEKNEAFTGLSFADMVISEHTVSGAQPLLASPEAYRNPRQILLKLLK